MYVFDQHCMCLYVVMSNHHISVPNTDNEAHHIQYCLLFVVDNMKSATITSFMC